MSRTVLCIGCVMLPAVVSAESATINGGGARLPRDVYVAEFRAYNRNAGNGAQFSTYWDSGDAVGQLAFLNDDLSCDMNAGQCDGNGGAPGNEVQYASSVLPLSDAQLAIWSTSSFGQSYAGSLIQLPAMGAGIAIAVNDSNVTTNGQVVLNDNDLCGIFSGLITDFGQLTGSHTAAPGTFTVAYHSGAAATTFLLTNHLSAVCNSSNTNAGVTFQATTVFTSLFTPNIAAVLPNAIGFTEHQGVADYLAGLTRYGAVPLAIGYLPPSQTTIDPNSNEVLSNGQPSPLVVAALDNGKSKLLPTTGNILDGLTHPAQGTNLTPPTTAQQASNPQNWLPLIQTVNSGYPVVGYTAWELPQCFNDPAVAAGVLAFLTDHYSINPTYLQLQRNNGFSAVSNYGPDAFLAALKRDMLANKDNWNVNIGNSTACAGMHGR